MKKKEPKFEVTRTRGGGYFYFNLVAPNGEIIATGEVYTTKAKCVAGIRAIRKYAAKARIVDTKERGS